MRRKIIAGVAVALVSLAAYAAGKCPIDGSDTYSTGVTMTDQASGKLLWQVKCLLHGHVLWSTEP